MEAGLNTRFFNSRHDSILPEKRPKYNYAAACNFASRLLSSSDQMKPPATFATH
jgi:hypothetical protein